MQHEKNYQHINKERKKKQKRKKLLLLICQLFSGRYTVNSCQLAVYKGDIQIQLTLACCYINNSNYIELLNKSF